MKPCEKPVYSGMAQSFRGRPCGKCPPCREAQGECSCRAEECHMYHPGDKAFHRNYFCTHLKTWPKDYPHTTCGTPITNPRTECVLKPAEAGGEWPPTPSDDDFLMAHKESGLTMCKKAEAKIRALEGEIDSKTTTIKNTHLRLEMLARDIYCPTPTFDAISLKAINWRARAEKAEAELDEARKQLAVVVDCVRKISQHPKWDKFPELIELEAALIGAIQGKVLVDEEEAQWWAENKRFSTAYKLANKNKSLQAEIERLRGLLKPFAEVGSREIRSHWSYSDFIIEVGMDVSDLRVADFFEAKAALEEKL